MNQFTLEAPGVEDKWYSIARIDQELQSQPNLKLGRVGAIVKKYEALPQVQPQEHKKFLKKLQDDRKNLPWKLKDATGKIEYDATAEETTAVFFVLKRRANSNTFTVHRCTDWYEFRKSPRPAVPLNYEDANKVLTSRDPKTKFEERLLKGEPDPELRKEEESDDLEEKKEEEEDWAEGEFGEQINDEGKEERVKIYKTEVAKKLSDFGKSVKKSLGDEDVSSEDETLQEFQKRFEESKKQKTPEPAEEKKKKKRKNDEEVPEVAPPKPKKARLEHVSQVKTETAPQVQEGLTVADFKEQLESLLDIRGPMIMKAVLKHFQKDLQRTPNGKGVFREALSATCRLKERADGKTMVYLPSQEHMRH